MKFVPKSILRWLHGIENGTQPRNGRIRRHIHQWILDQAGHKCSICGWKKLNPKTKRCPVQIHHINGNSDDSSFPNLSVLCPNCHALTSTFGALNKNKGKKRKRY